jgi:hypothetical protein
MQFKDWVQFILQRMIWYMETPRSERKAMRQQEREPWSVRWFGMIPFSMKMVMDRHKERWRGK